MWKAFLVICGLIAVLVLAFFYRATLFDDAYGFRGPIEITIETTDGSVPEFPFTIESAHVETGGHGGSGVDIDYKHEKVAYAGKPVTFPREHVDLLRPNGYAKILFVIHHPNYRNTTFRRGIAPIDADDPIKLTIKMTPFEQHMATIIKRADIAKVSMAELNKESDEYSDLNITYKQQRFFLGRAIKWHLAATKDQYLTYFSKPMQEKIIKKYQPIHKAWYYRYPETDCDSGCYYAYKRHTRKYQYNGI